MMMIAFTWTQLIWYAALGFGFFLVSTAAVVFALLKLPATFFVAEGPAALCSNRKSLTKWAFVVSRNILGVLVIILGAIMAIPGVPGPGLLVILLGLFLLDFPGKHHLVRRFLAQPRIRHGINALRMRFGKAPLFS